MSEITIEEIRTLSLSDPVIRMVLDANERGQISYLGAMMLAVKILHEQHERDMQTITDLHANGLPPRIIVTDSMEKALTWWNNQKSAPQPGAGETE